MISSRRSTWHFTPVAVKLLVSAFDDAWAVVSVSDATNDENREAKRIELARIVVEIAERGELDRGRLSRAALARVSRAFDFGVAGVTGAQPMPRSVIDPQRAAGRMVRIPVKADSHAIEGGQ